MISNSFRDRILSKVTFLQKQKHNSNYWNITEEQGIFLSNLVELKKPKNILEIGTSNGFSTLFLCLNLALDSKVTTVEVDSTRFELSKSNFVDAGLSSIVDSVNDDAISFLKGLDSSSSFDLCFVDAGHQFYLEVFELIVSKKIIGSSGILIFDNVTSHKSLSEFVSKVSADFDTELLDLGGGMLVVYF